MQILVSLVLLFLFLFIFYLLKIRYLLLRKCYEFCCGSSLLLYYIILYYFCLCVLDLYIHGGTNGLLRFSFQSHLIDLMSVALRFFFLISLIDRLID